MYQERLVDRFLDKYQKNMPAILIEGAKSVGKTESCRQRSKTIYRMNREVDRDILLANPERLFNDPKPILIDEWQITPEIWNEVKMAIDNGLEPGSVLLTGSSIHAHSNVHSGAGRIVRQTLRPFTLEEREFSKETISINDLFSQNKKINGRTEAVLDDYLHEIFASGFPNMNRLESETRKVYLDSYMKNLIDRDFVENGIAIRQPKSIFAWLQTYAAAIGTTAKYQTILETASKRNNETPSKVTAQKYRDALKMLYIIDEVPAFLGYGQVFKNLAKAPKHFMIDPALAVRLLDISKEQLTNYKPPKFMGSFNISLIGQLLESLVYQTLRSYSDFNNASLYHLRDYKGTREIDFILQKKNKLILFEVKANLSISNDSVKHLNWFEELGNEEYEIIKVLLYPGRAAYTRKDNVHVIPIGMLSSFR